MPAATSPLITTDSGTSAGWYGSRARHEVCQPCQPSHGRAGRATRIIDNETTPFEAPTNERSDMRLQNKIAIVVGAGQGPGTGMGNGRATVIRFAQEGAKVLCVDKDLKSAEETAAIAAKETNAGECAAFEADVTREAAMKAMIEHCKAKWGRVDVLHYNVGFSIAGGDAPPTEITEEAFDRITAVNLRGCVMAVKHELPVMRAQKSGVILTISSLAADELYPYATYTATPAAGRR